LVNTFRSKEKNYITEFYNSKTTFPLNTVNGRVQQTCGVNPWALTAIGWPRRIHQQQRALTDPFHNS